MTRTDNKRLCQGLCQAYNTAPEQGARGIHSQDGGGTRVGDAGKTHILNYIALAQKGWIPWVYLAYWKTRPSLVSFILKSTNCVVHIPYTLQCCKVEHYKNVRLEFKQTKL